MTAHTYGIAGQIFQRLALLDGEHSSEFPNGLKRGPACALRCAIMRDVIESEHSA